MSLRKAKLADMCELLEIERLCFSLNSFSRKTIAYHVKNNLFMVFETDGIVAGYYTLSPLTKKKQRRIYSIAVSPECRGRGIGELLMLDMEKRSKAKTIILEVDETNEAAISLYKKCRYEVFGSYEKYYGQTDALRMRKIIKK